ncbi:MAG: putative bifunctional diguanylate cyclase/phosphodiesterase [Sphingomonadaceae bacterium]
MNLILDPEELGDPRTSPGRQLLAERYRALKRQVPLLYLLALVNFIGLYFTTEQRYAFGLNVPTIIGVVIIVRLVHWIAGAPSRPDSETIIAELRKTWWIAAFVSALTGAWAVIALHASHGGPDTPYITLFASLVAIGCSYALTGYPAAARLPLLLIGVPLAICLIMEGRPDLVSAGVSILVMALLLLRLMRIEGARFTELVATRAKIGGERERARSAELSAYAEKAKADALAFTDLLTGLANRRAFLQAVEDRLAREEGKGFALVLMDIDHFKPVNDSFGQNVGDAVLKAIAERLKDAAGGATVARMGGDEFALLYPVCANRAEAAALASQLSLAIERTIRIERKEFRLTASLGAVFVRPAEKLTSSQLLARLDTALYEVRRGAGHLALYSREMEAGKRRRFAIEEALASARRRREIALHFQPIFELETGRLVSLEALARWSDRKLGLLLPNEFIPIAEQTNVIADLDLELLEKAARAATRWPEEVSLSFNLSAAHICAIDAAEAILKVLAAQKLAAQRLKLEVTETAALYNFQGARDNFRKLQEAGVCLVLDDFGAGYASISYLREMRFDEIKLDGSLVAAIGSRSKARALLRGVLELCNSLDLPCVAEHIETEAQLAALLELGCRYGQGFFLQRPLEPEVALHGARVGSGPPLAGGKARSGTGGRARRA